MTWFLRADGFQCHRRVCAIAELFRAKYDTNASYRPHYQAEAWAIAFDQETPASPQEVRIAPGGNLFFGDIQ